MGEPIGQLTLEMALDYSTLSQQFREANRESAAAAKKFSEEWETSLNAIGTAAGIAIGTAATAVIGLVGIAIDNADKISKATDKLNLSAQDISELSYQADLAGVKFNQFVDEIADFEQSARRAAQGAKNDSAAFKQLGVDIADNAGHLKPTKQLLYEVADAFQNLPEGVKKSSIAMDLFSERGIDLLPVLNQGSKGMRDAAEAAQHLGQVIDQDTADAASHLNDQLEILRESATGFGNILLKDVVGVLNDYFDQADKAAKQTDVLSQAAHGVGTAFKYTVVFVELFVNVVRALTNFVAASIQTIVSYGTAIGSLGDIIVNFSDSVSKLQSGDVGGALKAYAKTSVAVKEAQKQFAQAGTETEAAWRAASDGITKAEQDAEDAANRILHPVKEVNKELEKAGNTVQRLPTITVDGGDALKSLKAADAARRKQEQEQERAARALAQAQRELSDALLAARGAADPANQAYVQYAQTLRTANTEADKWIKAGADQAKVMHYVELAEQNARRELEKTLKKRKEEADIIGQINRSAEMYIKQYTQSNTQSIIDRFVDEAIAKFSQLNEAQKKAAGGYKKVVDAAKEAGRQVAAQQTYQGIAGVLNNALGDSVYSMVHEGASAWDAFGGAAKQALGGLTPYMRDLHDQIKRNADGTVNWGDSLKGLGDTLKNDVLPQLSVAAGTALGGGGENAALGASIGTAIGVALGGYWAPVLGAVGGALGGLFDHQKQPTFRYGAGSGVVEASAQSRFGSVQVGSELNKTDLTNQALANRIRDFDNAIAKLLPDDLFAGVQKRLENASATANSVEELFRQRMETILSALPKAIGDYVEKFSGDLDQQVQALSDVLSLRRLEEHGNLVTDNLQDALDLIDEFGKAGERIAETYAHIAQASVNFNKALDMSGVALDFSKKQIVEFAASVQDAAGSAERANALWQTYFSTFFTGVENAQNALNNAADTAEKEFNQLGLNFADFIGGDGLERFKELFNQAVTAVQPDIKSIQSQIDALLPKSEDLHSFRSDLNDMLQNASLDEVRQWLSTTTELSDQTNLTDSQIQELKKSLDDLLSSAGGTTEQILEASQAFADYQASVKAFNEAQRQATTGYADIIGSLQQELGYSGLRSQLVDITAWEAKTIESLNDAAIAAGRQGASEEDLALVHEVATARAKKAIEALEQASADIVDKLFGTQDAAQTAAGSVSSFGDAMYSAARRAKDSMDLLLGDLSPFSDKKKLELALQGQRSGTVTPEQVLQIGRRLYASGADYRQLFNQVMAIGDRTRGGSDAYGAQSHVSKTLEKNQKLTEAQRYDLADQLAHNIADLADRQEISFDDVAKKLGLNLDDLAKQLGLSDSALDDYLKALEADNFNLEDLNSILGDQVTRIIDAIKGNASFRQNEADPSHKAVNPIVVTQVASTTDPATQTNDLLTKMTSTMQLWLQAIADNTGTNVSKSELIRRLLEEQNRENNSSPTYSPRVIK